MAKTASADEIKKAYFNVRKPAFSIVQGLAIAAGVLFLYQYSVQLEHNEQITRTMVFIGLVAANIFLTFTNRSFYYSVLTTARYKNNLILIITSITITLTGLILTVPFLRNLFQFELLNLRQLGISVTVGFISVIWFEAVKWWRRGQEQ